MYEKFRHHDRRPVPCVCFCSKLCISRIPNHHSFSRKNALNQRSCSDCLPILMQIAATLKEKLGDGPFTRTSGGKEKKKNERKKRKAPSRTYRFHRFSFMHPQSTNLETFDLEAVIIRDVKDIWDSSLAFIGPRERKTFKFSRSWFARIKLNQAFWHQTNKQTREIITAGW